MNTGQACHLKLCLVRCFPGDGCPWCCYGMAGKLHGNPRSGVGHGGRSRGDAGWVGDDYDRDNHDRCGILIGGSAGVGTTVVHRCLQHCQGPVFLD